MSLVKHQFEVQLLVMVSGNGRGRGHYFYSEIESCVNMRKI